MSSTMSSSSAIHRSQDTLASSSAASAAFPGPCLARILIASSSLTNSHTPSEHNKITRRSAVIMYWLISGTSITPTSWASKSPMARLIARPGKGQSFLNTRWGTSPSRRLTSPPLRKIRAFSATISGLWSEVKATARSPPRPSRYPATARESPRWAVYNSVPRVTATVTVQPLASASKCSLWQLRTREAVCWKAVFRATVKSSSSGATLTSSSINAPCTKLETL
mmetsp:Transcript_21636/g.55397  ORF Transcript_21636/g.55397 Transcript_21636/m.55397 type:complete len:224 (-) Transcript_21636:109-780(-)